MNNYTHAQFKTASIVCVSVCGSILWIYNKINLLREAKKYRNAI